MAGGGVAIGGVRRRVGAWWGSAVMWGVFSTACALSLATMASSTATLWTDSFEGVAHVKLLACSQTMGDNSGLAFSRLKLQEVNNDSVATVIVWFLKDGARCTGGAMFASCDVDTGRNAISLRTVLTDLKPGHDRHFQCITTYLGSSSLDLTANITVNYTETTTTTTTTRLAALTTTEAVKHESAGASTVSADEFSVPNTVVFVILALLIFFIVTCCVLAVVYFRGRRKKRRAGDCDALSVRSGVTDKDFWFGGRSLSAAGTIERPGGRILRQYSVATTSPPVAMAPEVPGCNRLVMQYQRPSDSVPDANTFTFSDRGYVSGSSVHYQEPWGRTLDDQEVVSKLSTLRAPIRALVKIPDFQGSPAALLPPSAPPPDQGSPPTTATQRLSVSSSPVTPTQETESTQA